MMMIRYHIIQIINATNKNDKYTNEVYTRSTVYYRLTTVYKKRHLFQRKNTLLLQNGKTSCNHRVVKKTLICSYKLKKLFVT